MAMKHVLGAGMPVFGDGLKYQLTLGFGDLFAETPPLNESTRKGQRMRKTIKFRGGYR